MEHWRQEAAVFLNDAQAEFLPSMRQAIDLPKLYRKSRKLVGTLRIGGQPPGHVGPPDCPFGLDDLIPANDENLADLDALLARLGEG